MADEWVTQMLRQGDAKVFKKYSQMKLQMKREALEKINRHANEERKGFRLPVRRGFGTVMAQFWAEDVMKIERLIRKWFRIKKAVDVGA